MLDRMRFRWRTVFLDFPADGLAAGAASWRDVTGYELSSFRGPSSEFATMLPTRRPIARWRWAPPCGTARRTN